MTCESKTSSNNNNNNTVVVFTDLLGIVNHGYSLTWCKSIFAYLGPTAKDAVSLRSYCKLFSKALKPLPCWTLFPHPKYPTLKGLADRLNHLDNDYVECKAADMSIGLKVYFDRWGNGIDKHHTTITKINPDGSYVITERDLHGFVNSIPLTMLKQKVLHILPLLLFVANGVHDEGGNYVTISTPISIIGESREHCIVFGGLRMIDL